jgi:hypothetical protein
MGNLDNGFEVLLVLLGNRYVMATLTLCGMVLTVLGAFCVIDAVRMPRKLGRTGLPLVPLFDEIIIVGDVPMQPLYERPHHVSRLLSGALSGGIGAASFAAVIAVGYRHGATGLVTGAALGLGLGLAVALRPGLSWLARTTRVTLDLLVVRVAINTITYFLGLIILGVLLFMLFVLLFMLILVVWIVLLPWMVVVWIVRRLQHRPSNATALIAPFAFVAGIPSASARARAARPWRDPQNQTFSARATRWALGRLPKLQKYVTGLIVGAIYAAVGQLVILTLVQHSATPYLLIGVLVCVGFIVGRLFELAVESLYFLKFEEFVSDGPALLDGQRVGLVTGLSLGTIVGIAPPNGVISQVAASLRHVVATHDWTGAVVAVAIALGVCFVPALLGRIAPSFVNLSVRLLRFIHVRTAMGVAGFLLVAVGMGLQSLQYVIPAR